MAVINSVPKLVQIEISFASTITRRNYDSALLVNIIRFEVNNSNCLAYNGKELITTVNFWFRSLALFYLFITVLLTSCLTGLESAA
jgi:hypothetical protein